MAMTEIPLWRAQVQRGALPSLAARHPGRLTHLEAVLN